MVHVGRFILPLTDERMIGRKCFDAIAAHEMLGVGNSTLIHIAMLTYADLYLAACNDVGAFRVMGVVKFSCARDAGEDLSCGCGVLAKGVCARYSAAIIRLSGRSDR